MYADAPQPQLFCRFADAQHGHAFAGDERLFPQSFQRITFAMEGGNHAQAGGTAVHLVMLGVVGEGFHWAINLSNGFIGFGSRFPMLQYVFAD